MRLRTRGKITVEMAAVRQRQRKVRLSGSKHGHEHAQHALLQIPGFREAAGIVWTVLFPIAGNGTDLHVRQYEPAARWNMRSSDYEPLNRDSATSGPNMCGGTLITQV